MSFQSMKDLRVSQAKEVCAMTDGTDLVPRFLDQHCPEAVRILDFPHAAEYRSQCILDP